RHEYKNGECCGSGSHCFDITPEALLKTSRNLPYTLLARRTSSPQDMRMLLLLLLTALPLRCAILRGYAVEHATGKALARTRVAIEPLPGTSGATLSVFTNSYGIFEFLNLPAGAYLVNASRRGFAPIHYGQKRW